MSEFHEIMISRFLIVYPSTFPLPFYSANKWEDLAPLPQKKGDLACRFFNGQLVVAGGMGAESMEVLPQVNMVVRKY